MPFYGLFQTMVLGICDDVFGAENFIAQMVWEKGRKNDAKLLSVGHEYVFVYARSLLTLKEAKTVWREEKPGAREIWDEYVRLRAAHGEGERADKVIEQELTAWFSELPKTHPSKKWSRYRRVDRNGPWRDDNISWPGGDGPTYDVIHPVTKLPCKVPERGWVFAKPETMELRIKQGIVEFREDHTEPPYRKSHIKPISYEFDDEESDELDADEVDEETELATQVRGSYFYKQAQVSVKYLRTLMGAKVFDNPKDHDELMRLFRYLATNCDQPIIMDFFAGSGSSGEAVMRLAANGMVGARYIGVQLPEAVNSKERTGKAALAKGWETITQVTRERLRRVLALAASESYERFVSGLQGEIEKEYGKDGVPPKPGNARKRVSLALRKGHLLKPEFKELWDKISHRTRYAVSIDSGKLIDDVAADMADVEVRRPRVVVQVAKVRAEADEDVFEAIRTADASVAIDLEGRFPLPNLVGVIENLMEATTPPMRIGRKTILTILKKLSAPERALANPQEFAVALVTAIKTRLADQLVDGIQYEQDGTWYEQRQFDDLIDAFADNVVQSVTKDGSGGTHIYNGVIVDSETIERPFAEALEKDDRIKLYVKLPAWFQVPTPVGAYNPDWAIVFGGDDGVDHLYLVRETKGTTNLLDLRPDERRKIICGRKHFRDGLNVDYRVVVSVAELPNGGV